MPTPPPTPRTRPAPPAAPPEPAVTRALTAPYRHDGGPIGVVVCHGFTGSPASMRPWATALAEAGCSVRLPLLPGHGTRWQDLQATRWPDWYGAVQAAFADLRERCDHVFVAGLSMGGTLALRLAQVHGSAVAGLVLVNPSVLSKRRSMRLLPVLAPVIPSVSGIGNDIAKPGRTEDGYDRTPLRALRSLTQLWAITRNDLHLVDQPLLVFRSATDHVVEAANTAAVLRGVHSMDVEERVLHDSFHVATLDHDAERIFTGSIEFIRRVAQLTVQD